MERQQLSLASSAEQFHYTSMIGGMNRFLSRLLSRQFLPWSHHSLYSHSEDTGLLRHPNQTIIDAQPDTIMSPSRRPLFSETPSEISFDVSRQSHNKASLHVGAVISSEMQSVSICGRSKSLKSQGCALWATDRPSKWYSACERVYW